MSLCKHFVNEQEELIRLRMCTTYTVTNTPPSGVFTDAHVLLVLRGEVSDLKLCLQSADRELVEVKKEKEREKVNYETESADLLLKVNIKVLAGNISWY